MFIFIKKRIIEERRDYSLYIILAFPRYDVIFKIFQLFLCYIIFIVNI